MGDVINAIQFVLALPILVVGVGLAWRPRFVVAHARAVRRGSSTFDIRSVGRWTVRTVRLVGLCLGALGFVLMAQAAPVVGYVVAGIALVSVGVWSFFGGPSLYYVDPRTGRRYEIPGYSRS
jgi:hypothetical protein